MARAIAFRILVVLVASFFLGACQQVVVTVDSIPRNTPRGQAVYITGNFNNWDPGDERYRMEMDADSTYFVTLPPGFGTIEYKFTRGDWTTVEKDICGYETGNRRILIGDADTVINTIDSWNDLAPLNCPRLTLVVKEIPRQTRHDEVIAVAGNFNSWSIDSSAMFLKDSAGQYTITIERPPDIEEIEFKLTRGDLSSAESDEFGNMVPNRILRFGIKDTIELKIDGWIDRPGTKSSRVIVVIGKLPPETPLTSELYMASNLNGWMPGDRNYLFQLDRNGLLYFALPRKRRPVEFKITRGNWNTVEVDKYGYEINNRVILPESTDTAYIAVEGWKDLSVIRDYEVTVILDVLPGTTPEGESFFIAGNFNGWNAGMRRYRFQEGPGGKPLINLARDRGMLEFKITRGSWSNQEVNEMGSVIPNRSFQYEDIDTVYVAVENWMDLPVIQQEEVTLVIEKLPGATPRGNTLFLSSDQNNWDPGDPSHAFQYLPDSRPYITIPRRGNQLEYKITRGDWSTVETDMNGDPLPNRSLSFGFADTVYIQVLKWRDLGGRY